MPGIKWPIVSVILSLIIAGSLMAQDVYDSEAIEEQMMQRETGFTLDPAAETTAWIRQVGLENQSIIDQQYSIFSYTAVLQCGDLNRVNVSHHGDNLYSGIVQKGMANEANLDLMGSHLLSGVGQFGNNNRVDLSLEGSYMLYGILQFGNNHSIVFSDDASNTLGLGLNSSMIRITQRGNAASLLVR